MSTKERLAVLLQTEEGKKAAIELGFMNRADLAKSEQFSAGYAKGLEVGRLAFQRKISEIAGVAELAKLKSKDLLAILRNGIIEQDYTGESAGREIQKMLVSQSRHRKVSGSLMDNDAVPQLQNGLISTCAAISTYTEDNGETKH